MPDVLRSRSVSRTRVTVIDPGNPDAECLDPCQLLESVIKNLSSLDIPLVVELSDEDNSVTYPIKIFTGKLWPIRGNRVVFGLKKLLLKSLKVSIRFELSVEA